MIRVRQVKVSIKENTLDHIKYKLAQKLGIALDDIIKMKIHKQSLDARNRKQIMYIYEIDVECLSEAKILSRSRNQDIFKTPHEEYVYPKCGIEKLVNPIIIVGSGPAGLFATYLLAELGYHPVLIERGEPIEKRVATVEKFWNQGILNENSNVQFGEGGAGTFSDGKLNTLTIDPNFRNQKVLETFVKLGADPEIQYVQKPHIGTDRLREIIVNMRKEIIKLGGVIHYDSCLTNIVVDKGSLQAIEINHQKIVPCQNLILAIGHSARDTLEMLAKNGLAMVSKPFAVGLRIEHLQQDINESQYGEYANILPPASYKLTYQAKNNRGVYSFCMCPGGYVVNASSEKNRLAINGMSNQKRDSKNANSAIVVTVNSADFGSEALAGIDFQRKLEAKAYQLGKGKVPIQLYKDYQKNQPSSSLGKIKPEHKGDFTLTNLNELFPPSINEALKEAIVVFGQKIKNFDTGDAILSGVESRTSSPVRILRDSSFEANIKGIYPCGEGSGFAGGIMTSAVDGLKVAETLIKKYSP